MGAPNRCISVLVQPSTPGSQLEGAGGYLHHPTPAKNAALFLAYVYTFATLLLAIMNQL